MMEEPAEFDAITLFDLTPEQFAWAAPIPRQIEQRRADMTDLLIFDILLSSGGVKHPDSLYPPHDGQALRNLLDAIEETSYDGLKKDCLIYFLLKWHKDGREERFQQDRSIPPQFVALADAYWYLDSGEDVPRAMSLLSDARLNRDYTSKILQAISLEKEDANRLVLQYVRTAKPLLTELDDVDAYSMALTESSLLEAWQYQRTFHEDEEVRSRIFRNILSWCLKPKPRAKALTQLLAFPLSNFEQTLLHEFALRPPSDLPVASIPIIQDLACVRLIHSGQLAAAVKLDRQFAITPIRGTFGGKASDQARKVAQERKQTMEEIMSVMPSAERQLLELELEQMSQNAESSTPMNGNAVADLSMSWEHIRPSKSAAASPVSASKGPSARVSHRPIPPDLPIPERSGAPRFGGPTPRKSPPSSAFTAVRDMFDSISKGSTSAQPQTLTRTDTDPLISSIEAPSIGRIPSISSPLAVSRGSKRKEPVSLFDSVGSANRAPNAFFQPPPESASAGTKRALVEEPTWTENEPNPADMSTGSAMDVSVMLHDASDDTDVEMQQPPAHADESPARKERKPREDGPAEFNVSVFGAGISGTVNISTTPPRVKNLVAEQPSVPPGAFAQEPEDADDNEPTSAGTMILEELEVPPPTRRIRPSTSARRVRAPPLAKQRSITHNVPGAFIADEEEDVVAPLPPVTPAPRRQTRKVRSSKIEEEPLKDVAPASRPRRSSRLSVVSPSSRGGSSSPEPMPVSPEKRPRAVKPTRQPSSSSRLPRSKKQR